jgi:hypothetical protein
LLKSGHDEGITRKYGDALPESSMEGRFTATFNGIVKAG